MNLLSLLAVLLTLLIKFRCFADGRHHDQWSWDHFVIAQQWPMTSCIDANNITHQHDCHIPNNVTTWTMHGLWPSLGSSQGPQFCNVSNPGLDFDPDSLGPFLPQLGKFWPNLYKDSEFYSFWKHEWCKHGTCASTLSAVSTEVKYFRKGIDLQSSFDLLSILSKAGIVPSDDTTYEYQEFLDALSNGLGAQPKLSCIYDKRTKTQYIAQIEFCLSKQFSIINCPSGNPSLLPEGTIDFKPYDKMMYTRMIQKRRLRRNPETCEQSPSHQHPYRPQFESTCRNYESLAYPTIRYF